MKHNFLLLILLSAIQFISCEEETPNPQTAQNCFEVTKNFNDSPNLENNWQFLGFINKLTNENICAPEEYSEVFLSITPYNEFIVNSSCNSVNGHYLTAENNELQMDELHFSTAECLSDTLKRWEQEFFYNLENTIQYTIEGDILTLHTNGSYELKFRFVSENEDQVATCLDFENNYLDVDLTRKWLLLGYFDDSVHCVPDVIPREMNIEFSDTNSFYAYSSVNRIWGDFKILSDDSISFLATQTMMFNYNDTIMHWDWLYYRGIENSKRYDIRGIKLHLYSESNKTFVFKADGY